MEVPDDGKTTTTDNPRSLSMKAGETPQHIIYWAPSDWLTSRVRSRSAMTADPMLRTVYFELLNVLYANGGEVPSEPEALADLLMLPAGEVDRCLPLLRDLGSVTLDNGNVRQPRVTKEIERYKVLSGKRRKAAQARWDVGDDEPKKGRATWLTPYGEAWEKALGGSPPWERLAKEFKAPHERLGAEALLAGWTRYLAETEGKYASPSAFAKRVGLWVKRPSLPKPKLPAKPSLPAQATVAKRLRDSLARVEIPPHLKQTWFAPVEGHSISDGGVLTVLVPSRQHADAMIRYAAKILAAYNDAEHYDDAPANMLTPFVIAPEATLHDGGL
jgi:hypothetical protein